MTKPFTRAALFAGVSLSALGLSAPCHAAGTDQVTATAAVPGTVEGEIIICNLAEPCQGTAANAAGTAVAGAAASAVQPGTLQNSPTNRLNVAASEQLHSGAVVENAVPGAPAGAFAQVSCATSGQCANPGAIVQRATASGVVADNGITNGGLIDVHALANAVGSTAQAVARFQTALWQRASGLDASNSIANSGRLQIAGAASAVASVGNAVATGSLASGAVTQIGVATGLSGVAANQLANRGTLEVDLSANASAAGSAFAGAHAGGGINQAAAGLGSATAGNTLDNAGSIAIDLSADADAGANAFAFATGDSALVQTAAGREARDSLVNSGSVDVDVGAAANGGALASAFALFQTGVEQTAFALGSDSLAKIRLDNEGSIALAVNGEASATGRALTESVIHRGVRQLAGGYDQADVAIGNLGSLAISADARAHGGNSATAFGFVWGGIGQRARAQTANATLSNAESGEISIAAHALASATHGNALALARASTSSAGAALLFQNAQAFDGNANVGLSNEGTISLNAAAIAHASGTQAGVGGRAISNAAVIAGLQQLAEARTGSASVNLENLAGADGEPGIIDISASAHGVAQSGLGYGYAAVIAGLIQQADGARADVTLANAGSINVAAQAVATGTVASNDATIRSTSATFVIPLPGANAYIVNGLVQQAHGAAGAGSAGDARIALDNDGILSMSARAQAKATHTALASANVTDALDQFALAEGGTAGADLANSGNMSIAAVAQATGSAAGASGSVIFNTSMGGTSASNFPAPGARAAVNGAIRQRAVAQASGNPRGLADGAGNSGASAALANSGTIAVGADARAQGSALASASALVTNAAVQQAVAGLGQAKATLDNDGIFDIGALASASATGEAVAAVRIRPAVAQVADNSGQGAGDAANVLLSNLGDFGVVAGADASGRTASALVRLDNAVFQQARATAGEAAATLINGGTMQIAAAANVHGALTALADAGIGSPRSAAVWQTAQAAGDLAKALIQNSGTITISAGAEASASDGWAQAIGHVDNAVVQNATGLAASASLVNDGSIAIQGAGHAAGRMATGDGVVAGGIQQYVHATPAEGRTRADFAAEAGGASAEISNSGSIAISGIGAAEASGPAAAVGFVGGAFAQFAIAGEGDGSARIDNAGDIYIGAAASAAGDGAVTVLSGASWVLGGASALANVSGAMVQQVSAKAGAAGAALDNEGTLSIAAAAHASGEGISTIAGTGSAQTTVIAGPRATALVLGAIAQDVSAGDGHAGAVLSNSGTIAIDGSAHATGGNGPAAEAFVSNGASLTAASLAGDAAVSEVNSGTLQMLASAAATGTGAGPAVAQATILSGDVQHAQASAGAADVRFDNSGTFTIGALAGAAAASSGSATAAAGVFGGILDRADGALAASVSLGNSGRLTIAASAHATADSGLAKAAAVATRAVQEAAMAATGAADARFDNDGTLSIAAAADAQGAAAGANANVATGVAQFLSASQAAAATLSNSGTLSAGARASALAGSGPARADAGIAVGVGQQANGATASAALDNDGTMQFVALADAAAATPDGQFAGPAFAGAQLGAVTYIGVHGIISQDLRGNEAEAAFDNSGMLSAAAIAQASGTSAIAAANAIIGIRQNAAASAGAASADISNDGEMHIAASAAAQAAEGPAVAVATVGNAIDQDVRATGDAAAAISNSGTFDVAARGEAAGSGDASAVAVARGASQTVVADGRNSAEAGFDNGGSFGVAALASAAAGDMMIGSGTSARPAFASAIATATGVAQSALALDFANSGSFSVAASGLASGAGANVRAAAAGAVERPAGTGAVQASFLNDGEFSVAARGIASAGAGTASANAAGYVLDGSNVAFTGENRGTLAVAASASAPLFAQALARGIVAGSLGSSSSGGSRLDIAATVPLPSTLSNSGSIDVTARASGEAAAHAVAADGILQAAGAPSSTQTMRNSGDIHLVALAQGDNAVADFVRVAATGTDAMAQYAVGSTAAQAMDNSGKVSMAVKGEAKGGRGALAAAAAFTPMGQQATAADVVQSLVNSGTASAIASAAAVADGIAAETPAGGAQQLGAAYVQARALGLGQFANGRSATQTLTNSGLVNVLARGTAIAPSAAGPAGTEAAGGAGLSVFALGAFQTNNATATAVQNFANAGTLNVAAIAKGDAAAASASAAAQGYRGVAHGFGTQQLAFDNSGSINVAASAEAHGFAHAEAIGAHFGNQATTSAPFQAFPVTGSFVNSGAINVAAIADGERFMRDGGSASGQASYTYGGSSAFATGMIVFGGANSMEISNSGVIRADAIVADGGVAKSIGIAVLSNGLASPSPDDVIRISNSGDIIVRQSADGGASWRRGLAIDLAGAPDRNVPGAPNRSVVNLLGGTIYGDITLRAEGDDVINVAQGVTSFDGVINPGARPSGDITGSALDSGLSGPGTLNILSGGTLYLRDRRLEPAFAAMYDGPSYAFVGALDVQPGGTIALDLAPAAGGTQAAGTYSQIFTDTAALAGALQVRIGTASGLYADSYSWDNVIDANSREGEFDTCRMTGPGARSLLLRFQCTYDDKANVDLTLRRNRFDSVAGLTCNGTSTGSGLEQVYSPDLTGGAAKMFRDLFSIDDAADYQGALDRLGGASYANYLQSFPALGLRYNRLIDEATACDDPDRGRSSECDGTSPVRVWSRLDHEWRSADGDAEAGATDARATTALMGADVRLGESGRAGISGGYASNRTRGWFGDTIEANGLQAGAYAAYDPGPVYLKAITTYSRFDGDSRRKIDFAPAGGTFRATLTGDPDVALWTLGLHGGMRLPVGKRSLVSPYVNLDYARAALDGFSEKTTAGDDGAELDLFDSKASRAFVTAGASWSTRVGGITPAIGLGYRYRFAGNGVKISEGFCEDTACGFHILAAGEKKGSFVADASIGGRLGPVDLRISYQGEFNSRLNSHSAALKLVLPLGGGGR